MNSAIEIVGYGGVVPAAVSTAVMVLAARFLPARVSRRYAAAVALVIGFFVGYVLLPSWAELVPKRHWHWLPYLGLGAMIIGPIGLARGVFAVERWLLLLALAIVAAWLLVPTWASLQPPRSVYVPILAGYLLLLSVLLEPLPARVPGRLLLALLSIVALSVAVAIAALVSLNYARVAAIAAAAIVGCCVASFFYFHESMTRGLIPAYAILVGGVAFVATIEPSRPLVGLLLAPAAPLALWSCAWGPLARLRGVKAAVVQSAVVLVPLACALLVAVLLQS